MTQADTWRRLAVETSGGVTVLLDPSEVFYLEFNGHDTLVRTARKRPYRSTRRIADLLARLPAPPFFRCHESLGAGLVQLDLAPPPRTRGHDLA